MNLHRRTFLPESCTSGPHPFLPDGDAGAGQGGGGAPAGQDGQQAKPNGPNGFPADVSPNDMTAEQGLAYWRYHARQHEARANTHGDYDAMKAELEQFRLKNKPPEQQALDAAREDGRKVGAAEAALKFGTQLVQARYDGILADRVLNADGTPDVERRQALVQGLASAAYLNTDGTVNVATLTQWADAVAPKPAAPQGGQSGYQQGANNSWPLSFGQGQQQQSQAGGAAAGLAEAERRFGKPKP